jgi:hypothetical protein
MQMIMKPVLPVSTDGILIEEGVDVRAQRDAASRGWQYEARYGASAQFARITFHLINLTMRRHFPIDQLTSQSQPCNKES